MGESEYLDYAIPAMVKLDPDGNMLWHKEHDVILDFGAVSHIYETNDKGFVTAISAHVEFSRSLMGTLKTDSLGNTPCTADLLTLEMVDREDLVVVDVDFNKVKF